MQSYSYIIIEDAEPTRLVLKQHLSQLPFFKIKGEFEAYSTAVSFLRENLTAIDLIFLDIELRDEQLTGLDILKTFPSLPPVIIISNHSTYAISSYEIGKTTDYLLKPYTFDRLLAAINRVIKIPPLKANDNDFLFIKMGRIHQKFEATKIAYIEAYGIYTKIMEGPEIFVVNENISTLEKRLESHSQFIRVHKSFIVNIAHIQSIENYNLIVAKTKIPIGGTYKATLSEVLKLFDVLW